MKIGILSMQKILNYGSFLQAFSLKKQFEKMGHDVYFIDIEKGTQIVSGAKKEAKGSILKKFDRYFLKRIQNYSMHKKMSKIHIEDYTKYLQTVKTLPSGKIFDLVVIGSDEVFNCLNPSPWGFSKQLFGDVKNAKKVVTYAASCGFTDFKGAKNAGIVDELKSALEKISKLSVRDANTFDFVQNITGKEPLIHLDPVFISDYDENIVNCKFKKPYLLVYAYSNRITDKKEIKAIKNYAKKNKLEILCVGMQQRWCKNNITASAFELLGYVKNATCIVTDTFHGTVFSIKYNKRFVSLVRDSNSNKLGGLLKQFGLFDRAILDIDAFNEVLDCDIDFTNANALILNEQQKAKDYFNSICS